MFCVPPDQNSNVGILTSNVIVSGNGAFGRWLNHEGEALMNGISALKKEKPQCSLAPSAMWGYKEKSVTR